MAIGLASFPDVYFCDAAGDEIWIGCDSQDAENALTLVWLKPEDTGAADSAAVPIIHYELELASTQYFLDPEKHNFTESQCGDLYSTQGVARVQFSDLTKGTAHYARIRARTFLGVGAWSTNPTRQIVITKPSPPSITFVGSGGNVQPFLRVFMNPPVDFGDGNLSRNDAGNVTVKLISYNISISPTDTFGSQSSYKIVHVKEVANQKTAFDSMIESSISSPLIYGNSYYVRAQVENAAGFSAWSNSVSRILLKRPGVARNVSFIATGALAFNVSWNPPHDLGAGAGTVHPLMGYHVNLITSDGSGNRSFQISGEDTEFRIDNLIKGVRYFASVRARSGARSSPAEQNWGYGPTVEAIAQCVDGEARPSVCGGVRGLIAVDLPSKVRSLAIDPGGSGVLLVRWDVPQDTGNGTKMYPLVRYEVEFTVDGDLSNAEIIAVAGSLRQYHAIHFPLGESRSVRVRAINDAGASQWSTSVRGTVLLLPDPPRDVGLANHNMSVLLSWANPHQTGLGPNRLWQLVSFEVHVRPMGCAHDAMEQLVRVSDSSRRNVTIANMVKGCVYSIRIRAENQAGFSNYSSPQNVTALSLSSSPTNFTIHPGTALHLVLNWDVPLDTGDGRIQNDAQVLSYRIDIFNSSDFQTPLRQITTRHTHLSVDALPRIKLYFRICALTNAGSGDFSHGSALPTIPSLYEASIALSSNTTGANVTMRMRFTIASAMSPNDRISIRFPPAFGLALINVLQIPNEEGVVGSQSLAVMMSAGACGTDCVVSAEMTTLLYNGPSGVAAGTSFDLSLGNIVNRKWAGPCSPFEIRTLNGDGTFTRNENLNISAPDLQAGAILNTRLRLVDARAGHVTEAIVAFTTSDRNPWPTDGKIFVKFPNALRLSHSVSGMIQGISTSHLTASVLTENFVTFARDDDSDTPPSSNVLISIFFVRNDNYSGFTGKNPSFDFFVKVSFARSKKQLLQKHSKSNHPLPFSGLRCIHEDSCNLFASLVYVRLVGTIGAIPLTDSLMMQAM